jgi:signal transduction histidine kinase
MYQDAHASLTGAAASPEAETAMLRRGLRDLAAVSLLHGLWDGRAVRDIADGLCGTVYRLLDLDLSVVRVGGEDGFTVSYPPNAPGADELLRLAAVVRDPSGRAEPGIVAHVQDLEGLEALAGGRSSRPGFPSAIEALIFRAVSNEASIAARASHRLETARAAQQTLEAVVQQMPIGVLIAEAPTGRIIARNAAFDRIMAPLTAHAASPSGGDGDETMLTWERRLGLRRPDGSPYARERWPLERSLQGEVVSDEDIELLAPSGSTITLSVSSAPVVDGTGSVVAAVAAVSDVSARREADAVRDAFISMLSHELRTPTTSIYAGAQLLRRKSRAGAAAPDVDRLGIVDDIAVEAERLDRIVQNFLVLAKVDRGAEISGREPVLIQRLVPRMLDRERQRWPDRTFVNALPADLPPVAADEASVELVVRNLLNNAAKYGGPGVEVRVEATVGEGDVRTEILDTGPGVTELEAEQAFSLFYRSPRVSRASDGAGVGLYVVRSIVRSMGGSTWAAPREERGARFGFSLPQWADARAGDPEGASSGEGDIEAPIRVGRPVGAAIP